MADEDDSAAQREDEPQLDPASLPPGVIVGSPFLSLAEAGAWLVDRVIKPQRRGLGVADEDNDPLALLNHAGATFKTALARGELVATGINAATGAREVIPALFWIDATVAAVPLPPQWPDGRALRKDGQEPYRAVRIDRRQLERAWPDGPSAAPAAIKPPQSPAKTGAKRVVPGEWMKAQMRRRKQTGELKSKWSLEAKELSKLGDAAGLEEPHSYRGIHGRTDLKTEYNKLLDE